MLVRFLENFLNKEALSRFLFPLVLDKTFVPVKPTVVGKKMSCGPKSIFDEGASPLFREEKPDFEAGIIGNDPLSDVKGKFLRNMVSLNVFRAKIPIRSIDSVLVSKSDLREYDSLYAFGKHNYNLYRENYSDMSEQDYFRMCARDGFKSGKCSFEARLWVGDLRWTNKGGSHRVSSAHYLSIEKGYDYFVDGVLRVYSLNHDWVEVVNREFDAYFFETNQIQDYLSLCDLFGLNQLVKFSTCLRFRPVHDEYFGMDNFVILLLLNRDERIPMKARIWVDEHLRRGNIVRFSDVVRELEIIEGKMLNRILPFCVREDYEG